MKHKGYTLVTTPRGREYKHRVVWEAHHGPIPKGYAVIFLDGDRENCALDNLDAVPKGVLSHMNKTGFGSLPRILRETALHTSTLIYEASKLEAL